MGTPPKRPTMFMLAGPNGAGKTTLYETVIQYKVKAPFINADLIQRTELDDPSVEAAYHAARIAAERRLQFLQHKRSFVSESTFSHPSKLNLINEAKEVGFRIIVFHVNVRKPELSVARVATRVREGGHDVPEDKILTRYERNQPLIRQAVLIADKAFVYDNSSLNTPPSLFMSLSNGRIEKTSKTIPKWAQELYKKELVIFEKIRYFNDYRNSTHSP